MSSETEPMIGDVATSQNKPYRASAKGVKLVLLIVGFLYLAWGITQGILTFTGPCAARWSVATHYRGTGTDDLAMGGVYAMPNQYIESQFSISILYAVAVTILGISYIAQGWGGWGSTSNGLTLWDETALQIYHRFRPSRWVTWGIVFAPIFAACSFYSGVLDLWLVVMLSINSIPLHFLQSQNEALNTDIQTLDETVNPKIGASVNDSMFTRMARVEAWSAATVIWVVQGLVWFFHMGFACSTGNVALNGFAMSIPIVTYVIYLVLHVVILLSLTNYNTATWTKNPFYREWFFILGMFVIVVYTTVVSVAVSDITGGSCSS